MFISPLNISPLAKKISGFFSIANSFYGDGVNNYFSIPYADLGSYLNGSNLKFSISFFVKRDSVASEHSLLTNWGGVPQSFMTRFLATDQIDCTNRLSSANGNLRTVGTFTDTNTWYGITITFDYSQTVGNRGKIFVNGVDEAVLDTLKNGTDISTLSFYLMSRQFSNYFEGSLLQVFLTDDVMSLSEHQNWYNNGKPKDGQALFGSRTKWSFNPDNSGSTAQFSVLDSVNSITATSANMVDADKTTVTPY